MSREWSVELQAGRLGLRPIRLSDAGRWSSLRATNAGWLRHWESTRPPESTAKDSGYRGLIKDLLKQAREGRALPFVVTYDDVMVGQLTVSSVTWGSARWAQMGYWIDQGHAGRGLIPLAVALACDYCFDELRLHRIEIAIRPENVASLRVVEKLGFHRIGLAPRYLHIDGAWRDHYLFSLVREDVDGSVVDRLDQHPSQDSQPTHRPR